MYNRASNDRTHAKKKQHTPEPNRTGPIHKENDVQKKKKLDENNIDVKYETT